MEIPIKKIKSNIKGIHELEWTNEERKELEEKILNLRDDQLAALLHIVVGFLKKDFKGMLSLPEGVSLCKLATSLPWKSDSIIVEIGCYGGLSTAFHL